MPRLCLFVVLLFGASVLSLEPLDNSRIIGGDETTIYSYPHQVSIRNRPIFHPQGQYVHICGGSILAKNLVLTSAHCVDDRNPKTFVVVSGTNNRAGGDGYIVKVKEIYMHEKYNIWTVDNDVAILHLAQDLPFDSNSSPIELADELPSPGELATITGWGETVLNGDFSDRLRSVNVPILSQDECRASYKYEEVTDNMVCAGYAEGGKDMCRGDSGGPLVYNKKQIGIVSWGYECGLPKYPGVYSSVPALKPWILSTIAKINSQ